MFYYVPSTDQAYNIMKDLQFVVSAGLVIRNMHRWAAHLMVLFVMLHMCRVFYTGAYKRPREFNWVLGVGLFLVTLGLSFTGYLLPWDQLAYWAITVGTSIAGYAPVVGAKLKYLMLGGHIVGQDALTRFYALHVIVLPAIAVFMICGPSLSRAQGRRTVAPRRTGRRRRADSARPIADEQKLRPDGTGARHNAASRQEP